MLLDRPDDNNEDKRPSLPEEFVRPIDLSGLSLEKQFAQRQFEIKAVTMNKEEVLGAAKELYDEFQEIKKSIPSLGGPSEEVTLSRAFARRDYFHTFDLMKREELISCANALHSQIIVTKHLLVSMRINEFTNW